MPGLDLGYIFIMKNRCLRREISHHYILTCLDALLRNRIRYNVPTNWVNTEYDTLIVSVHHRLAWLRYCCLDRIVFFNRPSNQLSHWVVKEELEQHKLITRMRGTLRMMLLQAKCVESECVA